METDCLNLMKSVQAASEALETEADLYDQEATDTWLRTQEALKELSDPRARHEGLLNLAEGALAALKAANGLQEGAKESEAADEDATDLKETLSSRAETVLNIASAEFDRYHSERLRDLRHVAQSLIAARIQLHQAALESLLNAQAYFDQFDTLHESGGKARSVLDSEPQPKEALKPPSSWTLGRRDSGMLGSSWSGWLGSWTPASRLAPAPPS